MAGLDQGRHPMRFAVAASAVSGLLVAALTAAAGRVFWWWPAWHPLLPLLALGLALAALPLLLRVPARRGRAPGRVFLIVAAFTHKHWVAQLIRDQFRAYRASLQDDMQHLLERFFHNRLQQIPIF